MKITRPAEKYQNYEKHQRDFERPVNQRKYFKLKRFVDEYLIDMSAEKAWKRCGYNIGNLKIDRENALHAFNRPSVQQLIAEKMEERARKVEITQEKVLRELALIAFSNIKDLADWDGTVFELKPFSELTRDQTAVISEISLTPQTFGVSLKFKTYDKKSALIDVGKHIGMFWENNRDVDPNEMAKKIRAAMKEADKTFGKPPADSGRRR